MNDRHLTTAKIGLAILALLAVAADSSGMETQASPWVQTIAIVLMLLSRIPEVRKDSARFVKVENAVNDLTRSVKEIRETITARA